MSRGKLIIAAIIIACIAVICLSNISRYRRLEAKQRELAKERLRLEEENARLEVQERRLSQDEYYVERVAREKMGIVREGEIPYRIVDE